MEYNWIKGQFLPQYAVTTSTCYSPYPIYMGTYTPKDIKNGEPELDLLLFACGGAL